jgi:hypothetical protein
MIRRTVLSASVLSLALVLGVAAQDAVKSGPQVGQKVPGPFHPLNINGESAGKKNCLYCANGANPVAVVFARELTPSVAKLITKLDASTAKNTGCSMGSYAVFMSDNEKLQGQLEQLAKKSDLKKLILSIDNPAGPEKYNISKNAAVTVLLYNDHTVAANYAFSKADLSESDISRIVSDISKITK